MARLQDELFTAVPIALGLTGPTIPSPPPKRGSGGAANGRGARSPVPRAGLAPLPPPAAGPLRGTPAASPWQRGRAVPRAAPPPSSRSAAPLRPPRAEAPVPSASVSRPVAGVRGSSRAVPFCQRPAGQASSTGRFRSQNPWAL